MKYVYSAGSLTGGVSGTLDYLDGDILQDGHGAFVFDASSSIFSTYILDENHGGAENPPYVISPDSNAGNKRWVLTSHQSTSCVTGPSSFSFIDDENTKIKYNNPGLEIISNGNSAIDISNIGNIGIGKSADGSHKLDINGNVNVGSVLYAYEGDFEYLDGYYITGSDLHVTGTSGAYEFQVSASGSAASPVIYWDGEPSTGIYKEGSGKISFSSLGSKVLAIDSTGISVVGDINITGDYLLDGKPLSGSSISVNDTKIEVFEDSSSYVQIDVNGSNKVIIDDTGIHTFSGYYGQNGSASSPTFAFEDSISTGLYSPATNQLSISVNGSQALHINESGNIGIDIDAHHTFKLDIYGDFNVSGTTYSYYGEFEYLNGYYMSCDSLEVDLIDITGYGSSSSPIIRFQSDTNTGVFLNAADDLGFAAGGSQVLGMSADRIYHLVSTHLEDSLEVDSTATFNSLIYSNNKIGVGISDPTHELEIDGDIDVTGSYRVNGSDISRGRADSYGTIDASSTVTIDMFVIDPSVGARWDYTVISGEEQSKPSSIRGGSILGVWDQEEHTITFNETVTADIGVTGDTSDIEFSIDWWSENIQLNVTNYSDTIFRVYFIRQIIGMDVLYNR